MVHVVSHVMLQHAREKKSAALRLAGELLRAV